MRCETKISERSPEQSFVQKPTVFSLSSSCSRLCIFPVQHTFVYHTLTVTHPRTQPPTDPHISYGVFRYNEDASLYPGGRVTEELTEDISDHFPVVLSLKVQVPGSVATPPGGDVNDKIGGGMKNGEFKEPACRLILHARRMIATYAAPYMNILCGRWCE